MQTKLAVCSNSPSKGGATPLFLALLSPIGGKYLKVAKGREKKAPAVILPSTFTYRKC